KGSDPFRIVWTPLDELRAALNYHQQIIEVMCNSASHSAECFKSFHSFDRRFLVAPQPDLSHQEPGKRAHQENRAYQGQDQKNKGTIDRSKDNLARDADVNRPARYREAVKGRQGGNTLEDETVVQALSFALARFSRSLAGKRPHQ